METELELDLSEDNPHETRDRFFKLIIGTAAGFLAGRMAENLYDTIVERRRATRF